MQAESAALQGDLVERLREPALTVGEVTAGTLDDQVLAFPETKPPRKW